MKLTLVRHAEVQTEFIGKYNGHIDIPLSKNGKKQAKELAEKLDDTAFDKVYCSDLLRAKQTLEAFELKQDVIYTQELREKSWGKHEGKSFEEIESLGIKYENFEQWLKALDGEKVEDFRQRVAEFFYENLLLQECEHILVVTHSGVIKTFLSLHNHTSLEIAFGEKLNYGDFITFSSF